MVLLSTPERAANCICVSFCCWRRARRRCPTAQRCCWIQSGRSSGTQSSSTHLRQKSLPHVVNPPPTPARPRTAGALKSGATAYRNPPDRAVRRQGSAKASRPGGCVPPGRLRLDVGAPAGYCGGGALPWCDPPRSGTTGLLRQESTAPERGAAQSLRSQRTRRLPRPHRVTPRCIA